MESFNLQSCWCLSKLCCHHGHSSKYAEGVAHIKNDDVTVSNGVNLCHPKFWHATDYTGEALSSKTYFVYKPPADTSQKFVEVFASS